MSGLIYALALFGCSDDATVCERLTDKAQSFESQTRCEETIGAAFETDVVLMANFPTVIAKCMPQAKWSSLGNKTLDLSTPTIRLASRDGVGGV